MKLRHPPTRSTASDDNLIPMINVVFLLLVFFMVAGTIRSADPILVDAPIARSGAEQSAQAVLYVSTDGALVLGDKPIDIDRLGDELARLAADSTADFATVDDSERGMGGGIGDMINSEINSEIDSESGEDLKRSQSGSAERQGSPILAIKADADTSVATLRRVLNEARSAGIPRVELITLQGSTTP